MRDMSKRGWTLTALEYAIGAIFGATFYFGGPAIKAILFGAAALWIVMLGRCLLELAGWAKLHTENDEAERELEQAKQKMRRPKTPKGWN
jgi:hypothetical protein